MSCTSEAHTDRQVGRTQRMAVRLISLGLVVATCCIANISCHRQSNPQKQTGSSPLDQPIAKNTIQIRVTGHDFQWRFRYAGADGQLDTSDDLVASRHLYLPAHSIVSVDLRSQDYAYSFYLPHLDLVETAIPDDPFLLQFETDGPCHYALVGGQM